MNLKGHHFLRLEQVENSKLIFTLQDLQTALTICHNTGDLPLIFLLTSDGKKNHVYLGTESPNNDSHSINFIDNLKDFLEGNWSGTQLKVCTHQEAPFTEEVEHLLKSMCNSDKANAVALTGIPLLKSGDNSITLHHMNYLNNSLAGFPFVYMVIAQPILELTVNQILYNLRELTGQADSLSKLQLTETFTDQIFEEKERIERQLNLEYTSISETETKSSDFGIGLSASISLASIASLLALGGGFPLISSVASLLTAVATSDIAKDLKLKAEISHKRSKQNSSETTETEVNIVDNISAKKTGLILGEANSFGREYINSHAQAAVEFLGQYTQRFRQARSLGCWNVGVYFLADSKKNAQRGGNLLRGLLSGQNSVLEPIRIHDLQRVWNNGHESAPSFGAKDALMRLQQPSLGLVNPTTKESFDHILGASFNGLTTPLTTAELTSLVNLPLKSYRNR